MNAAKILESLQYEDFTQVISQGSWIGEDSLVYTKEIREDIYLLFVFSPNEEERIKAMIAKFDHFQNEGLTEPKQLLFYLTIEKEEDFHYFDKYISSHTFQKSIDYTV